jgi:hypothetical protein
MKTALFLTALASIPLALAACNGSLVIDGDGDGGAGGAGATGVTGGAGATGGAGVTGGGGSGAEPSVPPYKDVEDIVAWPGNGANCPTQVPNEATACTGEGEICAYWYYHPSDLDVSYQECGCWEAAGGALKFACYRPDQHAPGCATEQPGHGTDCVGHVGTGCPFPVRNECGCDAATTPLWSCQTLEPFLNLPPPPAGIDPSKPVDALTPAERTTWCNWYDSTRLPAGQPPLPAVPLDGNGTLIESGCFYGNGWAQLWLGVSVAEIPVSYCEGNLSLSTCSAPVSELTDCILSVRADQNYPGGWPYEHGCARYTDKPGCMGTIVTPPFDQSEGAEGMANACKLKVQ